MGMRSSGRGVGPVGRIADACGTIGRGIFPAPGTDPRRGRRRRGRGWLPHACRAGRPARRAAGHRPPGARCLPRPALAVRGQRVLAGVRGHCHGRAACQVRDGHGAAAAGLAAGAGRAAAEPRVLVLHGADLAGVAAAAARGHADVRVALLPFSWPFLGVLSAAAAVVAHLGTAAALGVAAVTGLVNARAWYGLAGIASRLHPRAPESVPARLMFGLPFAPLAALMVLALMVGVVRLMFTGTIQLPLGTSTPVAANLAVGGVTGGAETGSGGTTAVGPVVTDAVLVVGGWGSSCCDAANGLRAALGSVPVRQFSYIGLDAKGRPVPSGPEADDLPLPVLGDRMAAQLEKLHELTGRPVDVVAESEGTLGVYAMLDRHPGLPVGSIALLSPIVDPGRVGYPSGRDAASVSEVALDELNHLVGGMSPYGESGAQQLLS